MSYSNSHTTSNGSHHHSVSKQEAAAPDMADEYHGSHIHHLTRDYEAVESDLSSRPVEKNPERPPKEVDLFRKNRSYQIQLAERSNWWFTDPVQMLRGGKKKSQDTRTDAEKAKDKKDEMQAWEWTIKDDIRVLWDDLIVTGKVGKLREKVLYAFYRVCREKLEEYEEQGSGVALTEFQMVINETLLEMGMKLKVDKLKVLKEMATEKRETKKD